MAEQGEAGARFCRVLELLVGTQEVAAPALPALARPRCKLPPPHPPPPPPTHPPTHTPPTRPNRRRCECAGDKGRLLDDLLLDLAASGEGSDGISGGWGVSVAFRFFAAGPGGVAEGSDGISGGWGSARPGQLPVLRRAWAAEAPMRAGECVLAPHERCCALEVACSRCAVYIGELGGRHSAPAAPLPCPGIAIQTCGPCPLPLVARAVCTDDSLTDIEPRQTLFFLPFFLQPLPQSTSGTA